MEVAGVWEDLVGCGAAASPPHEDLYLYLYLLPTSLLLFRLVQLLFLLQLPTLHSKHGLDFPGLCRSLSLPS